MAIVAGSNPTSRPARPDIQAYFRSHTPRPATPTFTPPNTANAPGYAASIALGAHPRGITP